MITVKGEKWRCVWRGLSSSPTWANGAIVEFVTYCNERDECVDFPAWFEKDYQRLYHKILRERKYAYMREEVQ